MEEGPDTIFAGFVSTEKEGDVRLCVLDTCAPPSEEEKEDEEDEKEGEAVAGVAPARDFTAAPMPPAPSSQLTSSPLSALSAATAATLAADIAVAYRCTDLGPQCCFLDAPEGGAVKHRYFCSYIPEWCEASPLRSFVAAVAAVAAAAAA